MEGPGIGHPVPPPPPSSAPSFVSLLICLKTHKITGGPGPEHPPPPDPRLLRPTFCCIVSISHRFDIASFRYCIVSISHRFELNTRKPPGSPGSPGPAAPLLATPPPPASRNQAAGRGEARAAGRRSPQRPMPIPSFVSRPMKGAFERGAKRGRRGGGRRAVCVVKTVIPETMPPLPRFSRVARVGLLLAREPRRPDAP